MLSDSLKAAPLGTRAVALCLVMTMTIASLFAILNFAEAQDAESIQNMSPRPMGVLPGQKTGVIDLKENPAEYKIEGGQYMYYAHQLLKLDINGDGYTDLAVNSNYNEGKVYIFDGKTQVRYPDIAPTAGGARWKLTGQYSYYYGSGLAAGDVDGDGYDDLIVGDQYNGGYYPYTGYVHLYYGGPQWDSKSSVSFSGSDARFLFSSTSSYTYVFGASQILADLDGDGYDDVVCNIPYSGTSWWWWGKSTRYSGVYDSSTRAAYLSGGATYCFGGNIAKGDMNGDGRDEIAFGDVYSPRTVYVVYPTSSVKSLTTGTVMSTSTYLNWASYYDTSSYSSYGSGYATNIDFVNDDPYMDLIYASPYMSSGNPRVYVIYGKASPTYSSNINPGTTANLILYSSECTSGYYAPGYFGSNAVGDYNGNGLNDIIIGCSNPGRVYLLLDDQIAAASGMVDLKTTATLTIKAPPGSSTCFATPGYYYQQYWYYVNPKTLLFWDRDEDGTEEIFIGDAQSTSGGKSTQWVVWGLCSYNMISISSLNVMNGDLPDYKTYYAEYSWYGLSATVYNRWDPSGTDLFKFKFTMGPYMAEYTYKKGLGLEETSDVLGIMEVDPSKLNITVDPENYEMTFKVYFKFTLNMSIEYPVTIDASVQVAHIKYNIVRDMGTIRHNFKYKGDFHAYLYDSATSTRIRELSLGEWIPEDQTIEFAGPVLIYNGTEDFKKKFDKDPYYPANRLFKIIGTSSLYDEVIDNSSSGRGFDIIMRAGDLPILVDYLFEQQGIPAGKILNSIPGFYVNVDIDTPGAPAGIRIHADSFVDTNTVVDNEGEVYITWGVPAEYNSGIDHYEVTVTGLDPITVTENFVKVVTPSEGEIVASIKAVDKVGHVGGANTGSIKIEKQGLSYTNAVPGEGVWYNTYEPDVGYTITDDGGRFVIGTSVEYSVSIDGGETWGPWTNAGNTLSARTIPVTVNPVLIEGSGNMVKFKAQDEAGNIAESEPVQVNVDVSGLEFTDVKMDGSSDWSGKWLDDGETVVTFQVTDALSGLDESSIEYRYTTRSRSDLELVAWTGTGITVAEGGIVTLPAKDFSMGDRNHIQFRGRDLAGNAFSYSRVYNVWVNTNPIAVMSSPENGIEVLEGTVVLFDGTLSRDNDGNALTYTWIDSSSGTDELITVPENADPARFDMALPVGDHMIRLRISDGVHVVETSAVNVKVIAIVNPEWMTQSDKDGDGMPNLYEYIYHLGWDDVSNSGMDLTSTNDFDGDGFSDLTEYTEKTNPTDVTDFPIEQMEGVEEGDVVDTLLLVLVAMAILVIVVVIVVLAMNSMAMKRKLNEEAAIAAQEEQAHVQRVLEGGGNQRLAALKAASEGKAVLNLPSTMSAQAALPVGEPIPTAVMAQPVAAAAPAGWVAAPAAEPAQAQYANINSGTNVPPN